MFQPSALTESVPMKIEIQPSKDETLYVVTVTSDKGAVKSESYHAEHAMDHKAVGRMLATNVKTHGAQRLAALSFLGLVYSQPNLDGFAGLGDKTTGKASNEFKSAVRDAETSAVKALVAEGAIKLPGKGGEPELQEFLAVLRDDKNYSNAKVTTNKYFAFCGAGPVTKGGYVVPVPVMQARIRDALPTPEKDDTIAARLREIMDKMDKITISTEDAIDSLSICRGLLMTLEGIVNKNDEIATTQHHEGANVVTASTKALKAAMEKPVGHKHAEPAHH